VMNNLIKRALGLHASVSGTFKKTAANFHYEFNIRHISNVFQGLLVSEPKQFISADKFVLLWLHESERVYGDCLVSLDDLTKYNNLTQIQCKKHFPSFPIAKFYAKENAVPLVFCNFLQTIENPIYDQVTCLHSMNEVLENALREYNETYATMDLRLGAIRRCHKPWGFARMLAHPPFSRIFIFEDIFRIHILSTIHLAKSSKSTRIRPFKIIQYENYA